MGLRTGSSTAATEAKAGYASSPAERTAELDRVRKVRAKVQTDIERHSARSNRSLLRIRRWPAGTLGSARRFTLSRLRRSLRNDEGLCSTSSPAALNSGIQEGHRGPRREYLLSLAPVLMANLQSVVKRPCDPARLTCKCERRRPSQRILGHIASRGTPTLKPLARSACRDLQRFDP